MNTKSPRISSLTEGSPETLRYESQSMQKADLLMDVRRMNEISSMISLHQLDLAFAFLS